VRVLDLEDRMVAAESWEDWDRLRGELTQELRFARKDAEREQQAGADVLDSPRGRTTGTIEPADRPGTGVGTHALRPSTRRAFAAKNGLSGRAGKGAVGERLCSPLSTDLVLRTHPKNTTEEVGNATR